jgi:hypothetical protein
MPGRSCCAKGHALVGQYAANGQNLQALGLMARSVPGASTAHVAHLAFDQAQLRPLLNKLSGSAIDLDVARQAQQVLLYVAVLTLLVRPAIL